MWRLLHEGPQRGSELMTFSKKYLSTAGGDRCIFSAGRNAEMVIPAELGPT
jgi:hypothetical protein